MARPNVTVIINDESFVISGSEEGGTHRSGFLSKDKLIQALGTTSERENGIMIVDSMDNWMGRLKSTTAVGAEYNTPTEQPADASAFPFFDPYGDNPPANDSDGDETSPAATSGNSFAGGTRSRWPEGPTGSWKAEWWACNNYLSYGGVAVVADYSGATKGLENTSVSLDSIFSADHMDSDIAGIVDLRGDIMGVVGIHDEIIESGEPESIDPVYAAELATSSNQNMIYVYGRKIHRDWRRLNASVDPTSSEIVKTTLASDVAGCLARTDRLTSPWFSPAGIRRGQILDVIRLSREVSPTEQDTLYNAGINPVVSFPGEGTILFGDKTSAASTSTLSRINVARLFIYLQNTLGRAARSILFEQNDSTTRQQFVNSVVPFLDTIVGQRGITEYRVVCDRTNNTSDIIDSNQFVADVFVKPTKSVNFIRLRFTNVSEGTPLS